MKKITYYCDKCLQKLDGTRHKLIAKDATGRGTKYGVLLEELDLCEDCMAKLTLDVLETMRTDGLTEKDTEVKGMDEETKTVGEEPEEVDKEPEKIDEEPEEVDKEPEKIDEEPKEETKEETKEEPEENKTVSCSKVIKSCRYADKVGGRLHCGYINIAGHSRGCNPEQCNKYERAIRKRGPKKKAVSGENVGAEMA